MFLFELLIYVFFAWVMYSFAHKSYELYDDTPIINRYLWYYILFFTLISAVRWRVGVDSEAYIKIFRLGEIRDGSKEMLWDWLVLYIHNNGLHFIIGTATIAFFQIFFLTESLKRYSVLLIWLPIVLFGGRYYIDLMNGSRQMLAACGFIFLTQYIVNRRPIPYLIGILILSLVHKSALILIPFYFVTYIPFSKLRLADRRVLCLLILVVCIIAGQTPTFSNAIGYVQKTTTLVGYDNYTEYYRVIMEGRTHETLSFGPMMISYILCAVFLIIYGPKLREEYCELIPAFDIWFFFALLYSCAYFLVCQLGHMMIRPVQYFELFQAIMLSLLLYFLHSNKVEYRNIFYTLLCVIWLNTSVDVYKSTGKSIEYSTYKTIFGKY